MAMDYNKTLKLPKTAFPMRGNLAKREPEIIKKWEDEKLYNKVIARNEGKPSYILHDGPPYANGQIHLGTALNKVLKDFIIKYKNMTGYYAPYVPGWDTHGLPIELKALRAKHVEKTSISPVELRKDCHDFAMMHVKNQMKQFKRLGSLGDYDHPYLTLRHEYEARQIEVFGKMARDGYLYKGLKPVYWCPDCNTALAEAEIEYQNDPCRSIYVKFAVSDDKGVFTKLGIDKSKIYFVIWTTTTWTIPGNLAICVGPEYDYTLVHSGNEYYVMASELVDGVMKEAGISDYETVGSFKGSELEYMKAKHPLYDRDSLVIVGDHVTLDSGTGCVHTAPGYGVDDFEVCKKYDEIGIIVCVDPNGRQTKEAGKYEGLTTDEANKVIFDDLKNSGALFAYQDIVHQYPHCWRCKKPIIYRATDQWFCSVKGFRDKALEAIKTVKWIPEWGEGRISNMVRDRSDWCISRQRTWGVPIPVLYCKDCGKTIITEETIKKISDVFREKGSDAWWTEDVSEFVPEGLKCECGCSEFTKEKDIMDVWFDSGVSHTAVLDEYENLESPADLYLEGADQYRGWFQSSLLTSVVYKGQAPYKTVCTHGWVVDGEGRKMSKSLGNGIEPEEIINKYGADILRLWVASSDYHADIRISKEILSHLSDAYKKIRNTARFILSNLGDKNDFDPDKDMVAFDELEEIDKYALYCLDKTIEKVLEGYENFDFNSSFHALHNFCVVDMSNFYLDIIKDRLYCDGENSKSRKAAQSTMYIILSSFARLIAPILTFTSEEIWSFMNHSSSDNTESIYLNDMPKANNSNCSAEFVEKWENISKIRETVNKLLEEKRNDKLIGKSLEAKVTITVSGDEFEAFSNDAKELEKVLIVSAVEIKKGDTEEPIYEISRAEGEKCERCWKYLPSVGKDSDHPTLCSRCASVVKNGNFNL